MRKRIITMLDRKIIKNDATTSVISVILICTIFFSIAGGVLIMGPEMLDEGRKDSHKKSDYNYYATMYESMKDLSKSGSGTIATGEIVVEEGSVEIDSKGDKIALSYSYDPNFDFTSSDILNEAESFSINMINGQTVDKAQVTWLDNNCFLAGTKVLMANYSYKNIEDIEIGDEVLSYNEITEEYEEKDVINTFMQAPRDTLYFELNHNLMVTPNHMFYTPWHGLVQAYDLEDEAYVSRNTSTWYSVTITDTFIENVSVYDLTVEENHNFFVNLSLLNVDVLVGDSTKSLSQHYYLCDGLNCKGFEKEYEYISPYSHCCQSESALKDDSDPDFVEFSSDDYEGITTDDNDHALSHATALGETNERCYALVQQNYHFYIEENPNDIEWIDIIWKGTIYIGAGAWGDPERGFDIYNYATVSHDLISDEFYCNTLNVFPLRIDGSDASDYLQYNSTTEKYDLRIRAYIAESNMGYARVDLMSKYIEVAVHSITAPTCNLSLNSNNCLCANFDITAHDDVQVSSWTLDVDNDGTIDYQDSGLTEQDLDINQNHCYTNPGNYTAKLTVYDNRGLYETSTVNLTVGITPTIVDLSVDEPFGSSPHEVEFTMFIDDPCYHFTWELDFGDDSSTSGADKFEKFNYINHTYDRPGTKTYTAVLTVTNDYGLVSTDSVDITVSNTNDNSNNQIELTFDSTQNAFYNDTEYQFNIKFTGTNSENQIKYFIDWGDGVIDLTNLYDTNTIVNQNHSWENAGVYEIRVKAENNNNALLCDWEDPIPIKIKYKYIKNTDEIKSYFVPATDNLDSSWTFDLLSDDKIQDSLCIQLFSDNYPLNSVNQDKGNVSFGVIWIFDLGLIEHGYNDNSDITIFESGAIFSKDSIDGAMESLLGFSENDDSINLNLFLTRGENKVSASGKGIYQINFENKGSYVRENINSEVYNLRFDMIGENKDIWFRYLVLNSNFNYDIDSGLLYQSNNCKSLLFMTSIINSEIKDIK